MERREGYELRRFLICLAGVLTAAHFFVSVNGPENCAYANSVSGQEVFKKSCIACHGSDGNSGFAPDLVSDQFRKQFSNLTELKQTIQQTMPGNAPGSLTEQEYQAVSEYLWQLNGKAAVQTKGIQVFVNGQKISFPVAPILQGGTTIVPLREIFEALGATVAWEQATKTVTAKKGKTTIKLTIGKRQALKNNQSIALGSPAQIIQGKTFVPLRFVSEALGAKVVWDGKTQIIQITNP